jgi:hypothetical protein
MKRYFNNNNLDIDPVRNSWNQNNELLEFHQPINKLRDDIMVNSIYLSTDVPQNNVPQNNVNYNSSNIYNNGDTFSLNQPLNQQNYTNQQQNYTNQQQNYTNQQQNYTNQQNTYGSFSNKNPMVNKNLNVPPPSVEENYNSNAPNYSLKTNGYQNIDDPVIELLPKNNQKPNQMVISSPQNYTNDNFKFNSITQELFEKDEDLQRYKNEVYQLQLELNSSKKERSKMISTDMENKMLKDKLQEQYELSRELTSLKHQLKRTQLENQGTNDTIHSLKQIIHKQHIQLTQRVVEKSKRIHISESEEDFYSSDSDIDSDSDSESSDSDDEIIQTRKPPVLQKKNIDHIVKKKPVVNKSQNLSNKKDKGKDNNIKDNNIKEKILDIKPTSSPSFSVGNNVKKTTPRKVLTPKKNIYQNNVLKSALLKQSIPARKIDETMIQLKITQQTNITKDLINNFIRSIKF